jgi:hypothetical protein
MQRLQNRLYRVGLKVFEEMGFLLPTMEIDEKQASAVFEAAVSVDFSGPIKGTMLLTLSGNILAGLAANMLGEEELPDLSQQHDALKEVSNVICGNLLPYICGSESVFEIGEPQIRSQVDINKGIYAQAAVKQAIGLEGGRADLSLYISDDYLPKVPI